MLLSNFHTHTKYCDGIEDPEEYVRYAVKNKISVLGFSAHAPVPFSCNWPLPLEKLEEYLSIIETFKNRFNGEIEIYSGLEIDYIPELWLGMQGNIKPQRLDYIIGSIHFIDRYDDGTPWTIDGNNEDFKKGLAEIFNNDHHTVFRKYFEYTREMVRTMKPIIIGHIDKLKMQYYHSGINPDEDDVYKEEFYSTLEEISDADCIVEINTRGVYRRNEKEYYPGLWAMKAMADLQIPVTVNSDAHRPIELINHWNEAHKLLYEVGYRKVKILRKGVWEDQKITIS